MTKCAIIPIDDPSPIAFINVFEEGDYWEKIKGCKDCPEERRVKCCGSCYWFIKGGYCHWQTLEIHSSKPWYCVVAPTPDDMKSNCALEYKCIKGSQKGQIRRLRDKRYVFQNS